MKQPDVSTTTITNPQMNKLRLRIIMLLADSHEGDWFVFDPETADIKLVPGEIAELIGKVQANVEGVGEKDIRFLADLLELRELEEMPVSRNMQMWAMKIHLNHACNLACEYCYADGRTSDADGTAKGAYGGPVTYMSREVLEAGVDKFLDSSPTDTPVVGFFGGEALLSEHRFLEAVELVLEKATVHQKKVRFELTTNGTRFTPNILQCLKDNGFSVAVSLDGDKETNDIQRPLANGKSSYDMVLNGLDQLKTSEITFGVRMTAMRKRGGLEKNHYSIANTIAPVVNFRFNMYGDDALQPLEGAEEERLFLHYKTVALELLEGKSAAGKMTVVREVLHGILNKQKRRFQCGAGRWDRAMTPKGDVFPCHRFVGMSDFKLGNVLDPSFTFASYGLFENNSLDHRVFRRDGSKNCALCYAHHVCGGGCAQVGVANTGRIGELPVFYCQETRLRVRAVVHALLDKMKSAAGAPPTHAESLRESAIA